jgi:hypothetical protein
MSGFLNNNENVQLGSGRTGLTEVAKIRYTWLIDNGQVMIKSEIFDTM